MCIHLFIHCLHKHRRQPQPERTALLLILIIIIIITAIILNNRKDHSFIDDTDTSGNPNLSGQHERGTPLLLVLGYSNGVQIWHITVSCLLCGSSVFLSAVIFITKQPELISTQRCLVSSSSVFFLTVIFITKL